MGRQDEDWENVDRDETYNGWDYEDWTPKPLGHESKGPFDHILIWTFLESVKKWFYYRPRLRKCDLCGQRVFASGGGGSWYCSLLCSDEARFSEDNIPF